MPKKHSHVLFVFSSCVALVCLSMGLNTAFGAEYTRGDFIVKYKSSSSQTSTAHFKTSLTQKESTPSIRKFKKWPDLGLAQIKFEVSNETDHEDLLRSLNEDPNVEFAEPNYKVYKMTGGTNMTQGPIQIEESWTEVSETSSITPIIAILDSGADINHRELINQNRVWENALEVNGVTGVDDDGNGYIDDKWGWNFIDNNANLSDNSGHGTHVAGVAIGATEDLFEPNNSHIRAKIMVLKFLSDSGSGVVSDAIDAVNYALNKGARVLNNSWGGPSYSRSLHEVFVKAHTYGALTIAAAGNQGQNTATNPIYPANFDIPSLISVASTSDSDELSQFSNYGPEVDLAAPGEYILSLLPGSGYGFASGTSMATPIVSGLAALIWREAPQLSAYQVGQLLISSGDDVASLGSKLKHAKRINMLSAVLAAQQNTATSPFSPDYTPTYQGQGGFSSQSSYDGSYSEGGGCGRVTAVYDDMNQQVGGHGKPGSLKLFTGKTNSSMGWVFLLFPFLAAIILRPKRKAVS